MVQRKAREVGRCQGPRARARPQLRYRGLRGDQGLSDPEGPGDLQAEGSRKEAGRRLQDHGHRPQLRRQGLLPRDGHGSNQGRRPRQQGRGLRQALRIPQRRGGRPQPGRRAGGLRHHVHQHGRIPRQECQRRHQASHVLVAEAGLPLRSRRCEGQWFVRRILPREEGIHTPGGQRGRHAQPSRPRRGVHRREHLHVQVREDLHPVRGRGHPPGRHPRVHNPDCQGSRLRGLRGPRHQVHADGRRRGLAHRYRGRDRPGYRV